MIPGKVKEETENLIVFADGEIGNVFFGLLISAVGLFVFYFVYCMSDDLDEDLWILPALVGYIIFGFLLLYAGLSSLINESVIIDKRLQSVVIKEHFFVKFLKSTKRIPFSVIKEIGITCDFACYGDHNSQANGLEDSWEIVLITTHEEPIRIYRSDKEEHSLKLEKIAEKIGKITDKKISYRSA